jgi:hypothetical protein
MEMQMFTPDSPLVTHWAYMSQVESGTTPPDPADFQLDDNLRSQEWRWIEGTTWMITDRSLFGRKAKSGVFTIEGYRNGYFWGSGTSDRPFNVLGSVTPEGNVLLLVSTNGREPISRTGQIEQTAAGGLMALRSYLGKPTTGIARTIDIPDDVASAIARGLTSRRHR